jgi:hypothetical protein
MFLLVGVMTFFYSFADAQDNEGYEKELLRSKKQMLEYHYRGHSKDEVEEIRADLIKRGVAADLLTIEQVKADVAKSFCSEFNSIDRRQSFISSLKRQYGIEYDDVAVFLPKRAGFEVQLNGYCNTKEAVASESSADLERYEGYFKNQPNGEQQLEYLRKQHEGKKYKNKYYDALTEVPFSMNEVELIRERFTSSTIDVKSKLLKLFEQEWSISSKEFLWTYLEENTDAPICVEVLKTLEKREQLDVDKIKNVISKAKEANDTVLEEEAFSFLGQQHGSFQRSATRTLADYLSSASPERAKLILKYYRRRYSDDSVQDLFRMLKDPQYSNCYYQIGDILGGLCETHSGQIDIWSQMLEYLNNGKNKQAALGFIEEVDLENLSFMKQNQKLESRISDLNRLSVVYNDPEIKLAIQKKISGFKQYQIEKDEKEYEREIAFLKSYLKMIELSFLDERMTHLEEAEKAYEEVIMQCQRQLAECKRKYPQDDIYKPIEEELNELIRMRQLSKSQPPDSEFNRFKEEIRKKYDEPVRLMYPDTPDMIGAVSDGKQVMISGRWETWTADVLERAEHYIENGKLFVKIYVKPYFNTRGDFYGRADLYVTFPEIKMPQEVIVVGPKNNSQTLIIKSVEDELKIPEYAITVESVLVRDKRE